MRDENRPQHEVSVGHGESNGYYDVNDLTLGVSQWVMGCDVQGARGINPNMRGIRRNEEYLCQAIKMLAAVLRNEIIPPKPGGARRTVERHAR